MDTLQKNPKIAEALNRLAPLVTDDVIASLNAQIDIDKQEFATVAKSFLQTAGLIKK
jgi:osmoprotectant transport system substrate-binding protein